ncbi:hypothetical protein [Magnetospirillum sulfuroxidans]|uniref:Uncharacterized protein n=1 Tax=Magnetospirillum sulfuroxidans TaxID=611300 RepID=A0ABS5I8S7_9PROT|nr:hypothetical protein [Magnetospirillum sulfuroxidans]MBR9970824.1 hypothetical protein [Magnetospirillum sulfuroxidans]
MTAPHPVQPYLRAGEHCVAELVVVLADGQIRVFPLTVAALASHAAEATALLRGHIQRGNHDQ